MLTNRLYRRTASSRGGFTLVELLVVIGIIAILAGVALGPITAGINKAKQNAGLQEAHVIGLAMYSAANDNNQTYPDKSGGSADAGYMAAQLLGGGYINDASIFQLSGDSGTGYLKITSTTNTATTITKAQVAWDFSCTSTGNGLSSTSFTYWPLLWSTLNAATTKPTSGAANSPVYAVPVATNPFGTAGLAVFYINNSSAFVTANTSSGTLQCTVVQGSNNLSGPPTAVAVASGT